MNVLAGWRVAMPLSLILVWKVTCRLFGCFCCIRDALVHSIRCKALTQCMSVCLPASQPATQYIAYYYIIFHARIYATRDAVRQFHLVVPLFESEETFCVCKGRELIEMVFAHMLKMCTTAKSNMKFTNSKTSRSRFYFSFCFREKFIRCIARHWISTSSMHYHSVEYFFSLRKIQCAIETLKLNHINNNVHYGAFKTKATAN